MAASLAMAVATMASKIGSNALGSIPQFDLGRPDVDVLARAPDYTDQVRFDNYSLLVKDQRFFLHSGEFHTFRLPVPDLWLDILEKFKAAGLNSVSVYIHMGLINPSRGVVDFEGYRGLQPLYDAAKEAGITIVLRPDNEHSQILGGTYFVELESVYRGSGIVVPLTYNDPGPKRNFINGTGAVDLYGMDAYPQRYNCTYPDVWQPVPLDWHQYHEDVNPSQPWYSPGKEDLLASHQAPRFNLIATEFQSGSFDPWGPTSPGYEGCRELTGAEYLSVFNLQLWASNAKLISYYMTYGGTSWGAIPFHGVYTSYDYGAAITESRMLTAKYSELKRQGMFLRSSPEFYKTDWIGDTSTNLTEGAVITVNDTPLAFVTLLRNPDSGAGFWIVRQNDSTSTATSVFKLNVTTADGNALQLFTDVTLSGRESKTIVTDYAFGSNSTALYSEAQIFFAGVIDGRDVLLLHGNSEQSHSFAIHLTGTPTPGVTSPGNPNIQFRDEPVSGNATIVEALPGVKGLATIYDSDTQLILYADSDTIDTFWAPAIAGEGDFANFWSIGTNESVLVGGPYLVRSAEIDGDQLALRGDLNVSAGASEVLLTVVAPKSIREITWNGRVVTRATSLLPTSWVWGLFQWKMKTRRGIRLVLVGSRCPSWTSGGSKTPFRKFRVNSTIQAGCWRTTRRRTFPRNRFMEMSGFCMDVIMNCECFTEV
ncbi:hypothetical protein PM082_019660 [Marasmius tenuissimus]|nr:hypothetical protein PM082_019660 [Marasmius tenuissimus]